MISGLYLAWRYLVAHPVKTAILVISITLILFIPRGLRVIVAQSREQLTARAQATPLLVGMKGSPTDLVLNSLYYSADYPEEIEYAQADRVAETGFARAIPLYTRFHAQEDPIVGTTLDYFDFRGLTLAKGRYFGFLGECVVGWDVAARRGIGPGDKITSSPESVFDLAGVYPLTMHVAGVLAYTDSPDDDAIFVDVKTAWVILGLAHGHQDLSKPEAADRVLEKDGNTVIGNASVVMAQEITPENIESFHFHGDPKTFPITAVIAVPKDQKSSTLLRGRYLGKEERHQILNPVETVDDLLATILTVQRFVIAAVVLVGAATLSTMGLVFALSIRLRRREFATILKIGGSRWVVAFVTFSEIAAVLLAGLVLAAILTVLTAHFGPEAIRALIR